MKKILSIAICLAILVIYSPFVFACGDMYDEVTTEEYISYAHSVILDFAKIPDVEIPEAGLYISQPIAVVDGNDGAGYVFFLFDQNVCIGQLTVSYLEGNFHASFLNCQLPAVSNAYINATPFYLLLVDSALIMRTAELFVTISGCTVPDTQLTEAIIQYESGTTYAQTVLELTLVIPVITPYFSGLPYSSVTLDVPYVANESVIDPETGKSVGICWAAGTASILRYLRGNTTWTARNVYDTVLDNLGEAKGLPKYVLNGLSSYSISNYEEPSGIMLFQYFVEQINAGYPVLLAIEGTRMALPAYHGVVVCGYYCESDGTDYIQILDSNESGGKIWITVNRNENTFIYNYNAYTIYTSWQWCVGAVI